MFTSFASFLDLWIWVLPTPSSFATPQEDLPLSVIVLFLPNSIFHIPTPLSELLLHALQHAYHDIACQMHTSSCMILVVSGLTKEVVFHERLVCIENASVHANRGLLKEEDLHRRGLSKEDYRIVKK